MIYVALVLFIILNFTDFALTSIAIHHLGFEIEHNKALRHAMVHFDSIWPMFAAKVANTAFALVVYKLSQSEPRAAMIFGIALWVVNLALSYAVFLGILVVKDLF